MSRWFVWLCLLLLPLSGWAEEVPGWADRFRFLAVQQGGRLKPFDTFALETVRYITGKAEFEKRDPVVTMLQWYALGDQVANLPVVEFRNKDWHQKLGLPVDQRYFTASELNANPEFVKAREELHKLKPGDKVPNRLSAMNDLVGKMAYLEMISKGASWTMVPSPEGLTSQWPSFYEVENAENAPPELKQAITAFHTALVKKSGEDKAVNDLAAALQAVGPYPDGTALAREVHYNQFHAFRKAWMLYLFSLVCLLLTTRGTSLYWLGVSGAAGGWALHAYGFYLRCTIGGRPPVTNMYESVIWVAFGAITFALIFELLYRQRSYLMAAATGAVVCLAMADQLPAVLDPSIRPLMPVLRSNFWLTIHVLTITLGYAAFLLSMGLGHMVLWKHLSGPDQKEELNALHTALYKAIQVGVVLLAAGTLLGGVWANYSWGRFWGWDPKEVWALIALLGYLAILHARFTNWIGAFGIAAWSVLAFQGVLMAWYGVNFVLGAGLHSYGFGTGGGQYVAVYSALEIAFVGFTAWRVKGRQRDISAGRNQPRPENDSPLS
ncbi:cytochrome c biogenesis protein CcsA [bacterium]|nr:cytochrome c biogenesis protein CcsA [bacterium]